MGSRARGSLDFCSNELQKEGVVVAVGFCLHEYREYLGDLLIESGTRGGDGCLSGGDGEVEGASGNLGNSGVDLLEELAVGQRESGVVGQLGADAAYEEQEPGVFDEVGLAASDIEERVGGSIDLGRGEVLNHLAEVSLRGRHQEVEELGVLGEEDLHHSVDLQQSCHCQ